MSLDSLDYTVTPVEQFITLPDGEYISDLVHIEYVRHNYGNYITVHRSIITPSEFEGKIHETRYYIENSDEKLRKININKFSRLCQEIGELKEGEKPKDSDFLYKREKIFIQNEPDKKGRIWPNVRSHELISPTKSKPSDSSKLSSSLESSGIKLPESPKGVGPILNDDVPF